MRNDEIITKTKEGKDVKESFNSQVAVIIVLTITVFSLLSNFGFLDRIIPEPWNLLITVLILGPCVLYLILFLIIKMKKK